MTDDPRVSSLKSQSRNGKTIQEPYLFKVAHVGLISDWLSISFSVFTPELH